MIYDCFTFFNELDVLEIRLNILNDVVDKFVIVEATLTHQGKKKPLHFEENKARYKQFLHKIIHIVIDEYPPYEGQSAWILERYQRSMIIKGLKDCTENDTIMVSDGDEIPDPAMVKEYANKSGIRVFRQKMFYYFLNCLNDSLASNYMWAGTVMCKFHKGMDPQEMRNLVKFFLNKQTDRLIFKLFWTFRLALWQMLHFRRLREIENGGWHFSYLGGAEMIVKKIEAYAHTENNKEEFKDVKKIEQSLNEGKDIFGRQFSYKFVPIDSSFPDYIIKHKEQFQKLIKS